MYKEDVENYPSNYSKSAVDQVINAIDSTRSFSLFAPSGFGKSTMAKYICFNKAYRSRYSKLKKINFIYINLAELSAETFEETLGVFNNSENNKQKRFMEILFRSFLESEKGMNEDLLRNQMDDFRNGDLKINFYSFVEKYLRRHKNLLNLIVLDNTETINKPGFEVQKEFFRNFRDQFRTRIEYLFMIGELTELNTLNKKNWGGLLELICQKIIFMQMPITRECILPKHIEYPMPIFNLIIRHTAAFKEKLNLVDKWSGGYPPYFKYLFRMNIDSLRNLIVDRELEFASERLYRSLDEDHMKILNNFVINKKFDKNTREFKELIEMRVIQEESGKFKLFSPIFHHYLANIKG